jgi:hypothetical protein
MVSGTARMCEDGWHGGPPVSEEGATFDASGLTFSAVSLDDWKAALVGDRLLVFNDPAIVMGTFTQAWYRLADGTPNDIRMAMQIDAMFRDEAVESDDWVPVAQVTIEVNVETSETRRVLDSTPNSRIYQQEVPRIDGHGACSHVWHWDIKTHKALDACPRCGPDNERPYEL